LVVRSIVYDQEAQRRLLRGVDALANAVRVTLGPRGRHVVLERPGNWPRFTKDGVTVALEIEVADAFENMGAELVRQVASKTAAAAGDGTTTAIVLAQALCHAGMRLVAAGHHGSELKRELEQGRDIALAELSRLSRSIDGQSEIERIATLAANSDGQVGALVAWAIDQVGKDGVVTVSEGQGVATSTEVVRGLQFDRGYLSPYFITDVERVECVLDDAWVLACEKPIRGVTELVPILEAALESKKPLLVIAEELSEEVLTTLIVNRVKGNLPCCAVKCPSLGTTRLEHLRDLAVVTGATVVGVESGLTLERTRLEHLGRCERIVIQPEMTTLVGGGGSADDIRNRSALLRRELEDLRSKKRRNEHEVIELEKRARRLSQGVAMIKVGGQSESELRERKDRVEDAFCATRLALQHGVVPGGGVALIRCQAALDRLFEEGGRRNLGLKILRDALDEPLRRIAHNCGLDAAVVVDTVRAGQGAFGFDAARREYTDLDAAGVLDATKVVESALRCAVDVIGLMLTTQAMLADKYPRPASHTPYRPDLFEDDDDDY
jgi:chaperonin GroEL